MKRSLVAEEEVGERKERVTNLSMIARIWEIGKEEMGANQESGKRKMFVTR